MALKFTGDFGRLQDFADKLNMAASDDMLRTLNQQLGEEAIGLVREGFELSQDPDGKPWAPLVLRAGRPLEDTGGLKAAWHLRSATARSFSIANAKEYAVYHQGGTGIYGPRRKPIEPTRAKALRIPGVGFFRRVDGAPKRQMVPGRGRLPRKWRERMVDTAHEVLAELFKGS